MEGDTRENAIRNSIRNERVFTPNLNDWSDTSKDNMKNKNTQDTQDINQDNIQAITQDYTQDTAEDDMGLLRYIIQAGHYFAFFGQYFYSLIAYFDWNSPLSNFRLYCLFYPPTILCFIHT